MDTTAEPQLSPAELATLARAADKLASVLLSVRDETPGAWSSIPHMKRVKLVSAANDVLHVIEANPGLTLRVEPFNNTELRQQVTE